MSQDTENFEPLRRLLALKRHEQPPPGYFHNFSRQVIMRIQFGETGETEGVLERLLAEASWLQRIWAAFEAKPVLAGAFGVAICGLLITGLVYSDSSDLPAVAVVPTLQTQSGPLTLANASAPDHPFLAKPAMVELSSPSPITAPPMDSPFLTDISRLRVDRATLTLPGRN
jgi:hypothetical protein